MSVHVRCASRHQRLHCMPPRSPSAQPLPEGVGQRQLEHHQALPPVFLDWLDGGPPPETILTDNLQSTAMLFAAIQASETGHTVDVQALMRDVMSLPSQRTCLSVANPFPLLPRTFLWRRG